jgi:hypothetical protein
MLRRSVVHLNPPRPRGRGTCVRWCSGAIPRAPPLTTSRLARQHCQIQRDPRYVAVCGNAESPMKMAIAAKLLVGVPARQGAPTRSLVYGNRPHERDLVGRGWRRSSAPRCASRWSRRLGYGAGARRGLWSLWHWVASPPPPGRRSARPADEARAICLHSRACRVL